MNGCRLDVRGVLEQTLQDVDGFPDAAWNEVAEQSYVGIRNVVVDHDSGPAVAGVPLRQQVLVPGAEFLGVRCAGGGRLAPDMGESCLEDGVGHLGDGVSERVAVQETPVAGLGTWSNNRRNESVCETMTWV